MYNTGHLTTVQCSSWKLGPWHASKSPSWPAEYRTALSLSILSSGFNAVAHRWKLKSQVLKCKTWAGLFCFSIIANWISLDCAEAGWNKQACEDLVLVSVNVLSIFFQLFITFVDSSLHPKKLRQWRQFSVSLPLASPNWKSLKFSQIFCLNYMFSGLEIIQNSTATITEVFRREEYRNCTCQYGSFKCNNVTE